MTNIRERKKQRKSYFLVEHLLKKHPSARLHDSYLVYFYLKKLGINPDEITATDLLQMWKEGRILSIETLTRARRKAQELNPHLKYALSRNRHRDSAEQGARSAYKGHPKNH